MIKTAYEAGSGFYWMAGGGSAILPSMADHHHLPTLPPASDPLALGGTLAEDYHNSKVAEANDHEIRMSVMHGPFPWHCHPDSDEIFMAVEGGLVVEFEAGEVVLYPGQFLTVPRGVRHRTRPLGARSVNLTFERKGAATVFDS